MITMGIRIACFVAMAFVGGPLRWLLLAGAAFLPGIAVLLANAVDKRGQTGPVVHAPVVDRPALEQTLPTDRTDQDAAGPTIIDLD